MKILIRRAGLGVLIAGLASLLLFVGAVQFTNRSDFCTTCHYMQPYYDAWASSTHHNVPCRDCHYEPGYSNVVKGKLKDMNQLVKYITNAYRRSKPWAEVSDLSCLRSGCHSERLLHGRVMFGRVNFDHRPHLSKMRRGKKLRCTSCHSQIVQGEHMTVTESTCITCHFKESEAGSVLSKCTTCHDPPVSVAGQEPPKYDHTRVLEKQLDCKRCHGPMVVGDGAVPKERCYACHWDRERLDQYTNTEVMHTKHITESKIECDLCHLSMQHKSPSRDKVIPNCETCHEGFHEAQKDLFVGHGGHGVADTPNPMYQKGLTCQGCHIFHAETDEWDLEGETFTASGESCEPCHGAGYGRLLTNWKKSSNQKLASLKRTLADAKRARKSLKGSRENRVLADSLLQEATYNYDMVRLGRPIHNIVYSNELLVNAHDDLKRFFEIVDPGYQLASMPSESDVVPSACVNCHSGIEDIDASVFGLTYSHKRHLVNAGVTCVRCHSNQTRHGELIVQKRDCLSCHHSESARDCDYCHTSQAALLTGESDVLDLDDADIMFASGVGCRDCHEQPDRSIRKPVPQRCADCHDNDYAETQREWLTEYAALRQAVGARLDRAARLPVTPDRDAVLSMIRQQVEALDADGSRGSHNHFEQVRILEEAIEKLDAMLETTG